MSRHNFIIPENLDGLRVDKALSLYYDRDLDDMILYIKKSIVIAIFLKDIHIILKPITKKSIFCYNFFSRFIFGEMVEWFKAQHWKCCLRVTLTRVRIPLSPTFLLDT